MEQTTALSLTGGWENIVNNVERHNARIRFDAMLYRRKQKKKISKAVDLAIGAILSITLGFTGLLAPWVAGSAAFLLTCAACFLGGRIWEGYHR